MLPFWEYNDSRAMVRVLMGVSDVLIVELRVFRVEILGVRGMCLSTRSW